MINRIYKALAIQNVECFNPRALLTMMVASRWYDEFSSTL